MWRKQAEKVAVGIRRRVFELTLANNGGYLSQACSAADLLAVLYVKAMNLGPSVAPPVPRPFWGTPSAGNPHSFTGAGYHGAKAPDRDRFFVCPAHYALVIYAALIETNRMDPQGLEMFNRDGSSVEMIGAEHSPGMEVPNGSLAQGLSLAMGAALARKRRQDSGRVWAFCSDGELQEGQTWETYLALSHHEVDNLAVVYDVNGQQCDGAMDSVLHLGSIEAKFRAFGAHAVTVDGHDLEAIAAACEIKPSRAPLVVLCRTSPYQGMDYLKKRMPRLHYVRFSDAAEKAELESAVRRQLDAPGGRP